MRALIALMGSELRTDLLSNVEVGQTWPLLDLGQTFTSGDLNFELIKMTKVLSNDFLRAFERRLTRLATLPSSWVRLADPGEGQRDHSLLHRFQFLTLRLRQCMETGNNWIFLASGPLQSPFDSSQNTGLDPPLDGGVQTPPPQQVVENPDDQLG